MSEAFLIALLSLVGGGGIVKLYDRWRQGRIDDARESRDGAGFLFEQYQALIEEDRRTIRKLTGRVARLDEMIAEKSAAHTEAVVEGIRFKAEVKQLREALARSEECCTKLAHEVERLRGDVGGELEEPTCPSNSPGEITES